VSPSADRNFEPLAAELAKCLPASGHVLELGSGTGQHVAGFASRFPHLEWTPSDPDPAARSSIAAWSAHAALPNLRPPLDLDLSAAAWNNGIEPGVDALLAINVLQVAPWSACAGLMDGSKQLLKPGGLLICYGCFKKNEQHFSESNAAFDRKLAAFDARWGVRDVTGVVTQAEENGLAHAAEIRMPANNLMLLFRRI